MGSCQIVPIGRRPYVTDFDLRSLWITFAEETLDCACSFGLGKGDASFFRGHSFGPCDES
jgi:hypothetical protein